MSVDLATIEKDLTEFADAKAEATPGPWIRGEFLGTCYKHEFGQHPDLMTEDPTDPCEATFEFHTEGSAAQTISTEKKEILIGWDEDGSILSPADARFLVAARNIPLEDHCRALLAEVQKLRAPGREPSTHESQLAAFLWKVLKNSPERPEFITEDTTVLITTAKDGVVLSLFPTTGPALSLTIKSL